jgi:hypothetical protein
LSEVAVAETETVATSTPSAPVSDEAQELVSQTETAASDSEGADPPETGGETRTPDSYTRAELDEMYGKGLLNDPSLVSRRESLIQSDRDRAEADRMKLEEAHAADRAKVQAVAQAGSRYEAAIRQIREQFEEHGGPPQLQQNLEFQARQQYEREIAEGSVWFHRNEHINAIMRLEGTTDNLKRKQELGSQSLPDLAVTLSKAAEEAGFKRGKEARFEDKDVQDRIKAEVKKQVDAWKVEHGEGAASSTEGVSSTATGTKRYADMTAEERAALTPEQRNTLIAAQYRR